MLRLVEPPIRAYEPADEEPVVELSLRAWAPVIASLHAFLGDELFVLLRGDWRAGQATAVHDVLADPAQRVWVSDGGAGPVGFVAAALHREQLLGEVTMLAVDPAAQGRGVGLALTEVATRWLGEAGMRAAMIDTGGDPGHAPARHVYERAGFVALPVVRYVRAL